MFPFFLLFSCSTVLGVDLGCGSIIVSIATRNHPLRIALNMNSKRSTPNYFAFWNNNKPNDVNALKAFSTATIGDFSWDFGDSARYHCSRYPNTCLIGTKFTTTSNLGLKGHEILSLSLTSLFNSIKFAEQIEDSTKFVFSLPPSLSATEKSVLFLACDLIGLDVVEFVESDVAVANFYALEKSRKYIGTTKNVAFVDIGSKYFTVSIYEFNGNNSQSFKQKAFQVTTALSGSVIDDDLCNLVSTKYNFFMNDAKSSMNFREEVSRIKELLTIQPVASFKFDDPATGETKQFNITREDFSKCFVMQEPVIANSIKMSLKQANVTKIDFVEVIGGVTRNPIVSNAIQKYFNVTKLSHSLDKDSTVAMGAGYFAAAHSPSHQVKTVDFSSFSNHHIEIIGSTRQTIYEVTDDLQAIKTISVDYEPNQTYQIHVDSVPFLDISFSVSIKQKLYISFVMTNFLLPHPFVAFSNGKEVEFDYKIVGWEVDREKFIKSKKKVESLVQLVEDRRELAKAANDFESRLLYIKTFLNEAEELTEEERSVFKQVYEEEMKWFDSQFMKTIENYKEKLDYLTNRTSCVFERVLSLREKKEEIRNLKEAYRDMLNNNKVKNDSSEFKEFLNKADEYINKIEEIPLESVNLVDLIEMKNKIKTEFNKAKVKAVYTTYPESTSEQTNQEIEDV